MNAPIIKQRQRVLTPRVGTTVFRRQRLAAFTILLIAAEQHITLITSSKEVLSISFPNKIAAHVERKLTIRAILRLKVPPTTRALIFQLKTELRQS